MEPVGHDFPPRRAGPAVAAPGLTALERRSGGELVALGAAAGAGLMVVTSTGDALFLGVLLGLAAQDALAGGVAVVAAMGVIGRWGATSLAALAGGQAVLGPAGWTGSTALVVSSWGAAAALVLVAPRRSPPALVAFGLFAAEIVAGPEVGEPSTAESLAIRAAASLVAIAAAWACSGLLPPRVARPAAATIAAAALALSFTG